MYMIKPTWQSRDGKVKLFKGDCLDIINSFATDSFDCLITDPPYCSGGRSIGQKQQTPKRKYQHNSRQHLYQDFDGDNLDNHSFVRFNNIWLKAVYDKLKPGRISGIFSDWRQIATFTDCFQLGGFQYKGLACWDKTKAARPTPGRYRQQTEFFIWGSKGTLKPEGPYLAGVWTKAVNIKDKHHVAGKPTYIMQELIKVAWRPDDVIIDPFMGSGTTGVACVKANKHFVGIESNDYYFDVAKERIEKAINNHE